MIELNLLLFMQENFLLSLNQSEIKEEIVNFN